MPPKETISAVARRVARTSPSFEPLKVRRTFEVIVDLIKDRIFSGTYTPGDRLPAEREFAEVLGVGRPAVREAYRALELIGILEIRKGKQGGAFITEQDHRLVTQTLGDLIRLRQVGMAELTDARLILEKDVAELAIRRVVAEDIAKLRANIDSAIAQSHSGITASEENLRFHTLLGEMSGNPILAMMLASIMDLLRLVIRAASPGPDASLDTANDHIDIVDALQARDFGLLWPLLEDHICRSNGRLIELASQSPLRDSMPQADHRNNQQRRSSPEPAASMDTQHEV